MRALDFAALDRGQALRGLLEIAPGTEAAPGAGEDGDASARIVAEHLHPRAQGRHHIEGDRVQPLGAVQREDVDLPVLDDVDEQRGVGVRDRGGVGLGGRCHGGLLRSVRGRGEYAIRARRPPPRCGCMIAPAGAPGGGPPCDSVLHCPTTGASRIPRTCWTSPRGPRRRALPPSGSRTTSSTPATSASGWASSRTGTR